MNSDVEHVIRPSLDGLAVPKVETPEHVKIVEKILDDREPKTGVAPGSVRLLLALESPNSALQEFGVCPLEKLFPSEFILDKSETL